MPDAQYLQLALTLARRGCGTTSPNPMVGAVLVKGGRVIGRGWHWKAGNAHAEVEALQDADRRGKAAYGATLFVTLEPCCTHGCTPPCTEAIIRAGIKRVVVGSADPNPKHAGRGLKILERAGIEVTRCFGTLDPRRGRNLTGKPALPKQIQNTAHACARLNEAFSHWIVHHTPFVTVKAAMTLDGKIATGNGESKWITGESARAHGMRLRHGSDAILVGVNTILWDDPSLTFRGSFPGPKAQPRKPRIRRIILDSMARTPIDARVVSDEHASLTTIVVTPQAPKARLAALSNMVNVLVAPAAQDFSQKAGSPKPDLRWLLGELGGQNVTSLLVEGGGEVNASFLMYGLAQRVAFFYAPKILGGHDSVRAVGGEGARSFDTMLQLREVEWRRLGPDLLMTALVAADS